MTAGSNQAVVGHHIGDASLLVHPLKQLQCQLPTTPPLTGTNQAAVRDNIALTAPLHHICINQQVKKGHTKHTR